MRRLLRFSTLLLLLLPMLAQALLTPAALPVIRIASLEWPPYTSAGQPAGGFTTELVRETFLRMGYRLEVEFMPWSRAIREASRADPVFFGYFPEYPLKNKQFLLSASIGSSELRLIQHTERQLSVTATVDLARHSLLVVQDYVNTDELDRLILEGIIQPQISLSDKKSIQMIARKRADLAVIDKKVFQHLIRYDAELAHTVSNRVRLHPFVLGQQSLHLAVNRQYPGAVALLKAFDAELAKWQPN